MCDQLDFQVAHARVHQPVRRRIGRWRFQAPVSVGKKTEWNSFDLLKVASSELVVAN